MGKLYTALGLIFFVVLALWFANGRHVDTSVPAPNDDFPEARSRVDFGESFKDVFVFMQISDMHLSMFVDPSRIKAFHEFCNTTINVVKPAVVVASGDLTDGRKLNGDRIQWGQYEKEWLQYRGILEEHNVLNKTIWLDMRGNHDNLNVKQYSESFYSKYAVHARRSGADGSYLFNVVPKVERKRQNPSTKYTFIAVDAALRPGPIAPWNFFGKLGNEEFTKLQRLERESVGSNGTVWFGHYPTSFIITPSKDMSLRDLMRNGTAYLCGHLHTVYGLVNQMYTVHQNGLAELELADFKDNRRYRVAAFDNGVFSFNDYDHNVWPVILITNPINALFSNPKSSSIIWSSTHIRALVYSTSKLSHVNVKIDGGSWMKMNNAEGPLYLLEWEPSNFVTGLHKITIEARDESGQASEISQFFSLDGKSDSFSFLGRLALSIDAEHLSFAIYFLASIAVVSPLLMVRLLRVLVNSHRLSLRKITTDFGDLGTAMIRKLWITSTISRVYHLLILPPFILTIMPWYIGMMFEDGSLGIATPWCTYVLGTRLPPTFGYVVDGLAQVVWFQFPFSVLLCHAVDRKFRKICWKEGLSPLWTNASLVLFYAVVQWALPHLLYSVTSFNNLFLGDLRIYCMVYYAILMLIFVRLKRTDFVEAEKTWKKPYRTVNSIVREGDASASAGLVQSTANKYRARDAE